MTLETSCEPLPTLSIFRRPNNSCGLPCYRQGLESTRRNKSKQTETAGARHSAPHHLLGLGLIHPGFTMDSTESLMLSSMSLNSTPNTLVVVALLKVNFLSNIFS